MRIITTRLPSSTGGKASGALITVASGVGIAWMAEGILKPSLDVINCTLPIVAFS